MGWSNGLSSRDVADHRASASGYRGDILRRPRLGQPPGAVTQMIDVMLFGATDLSGWIDPLYGHEDAHQLGTYVGTAWGTANWLAISFGPWAAAPKGTGVVVTHWGPKGMTALRPGDWVMRGRPSLYNYVFSGVIQRGYRPWHFVVQRVPCSHLHAPPIEYGGRAVQAIKYLIGQRIYIP